MAAVDYKHRGVPRCVPVKGAEDLRMQVCSDAVPPGTGGLAQKAAKAWPPSSERRGWPRYVAILDAA